MENSNYFKKELNVNSFVLIFNTDYKKNLNQLKLWKKEINEIEKEINKKMIELREKAETINLLNIEKEDEFEFVIANDKYLELQREIGLAEEAFDLKDGIFMEKYKNYSYGEIYEIWKNY